MDNILKLLWINRVKIMSVLGMIQSSIGKAIYTEVLRLLCPIKVHLNGCKFCPFFLRTEGCSIFRTDGTVNMDLLKSMNGHIFMDKVEMLKYRRFR